MTTPHVTIVTKRRTPNRVWVRFTTSSTILAIFSMASKTFMKLRIRNSKTLSKVQSSFLEIATLIIQLMKRLLIICNPKIVRVPPAFLWLKDSRFKGNSSSMAFRIMLPNILCPWEFLLSLPTRRFKRLHRALLKNHFIRQWVILLHKIINGSNN